MIMHNRLSSLFFFLLTLAASPLSLIKVSSAFPTGAGGCNGGGAAVGGSHLDGSKTIESGTLTDGDYQVLIDGVLLEEGGSDVTISVGQDAVITVESGATPFRGILIRVEADSVDAADVAALEPGDNLQLAGACEAPVVGATHTINDEKTSASAILRFDEVTDFSLDITIVLENDDAESVFFYKGFRGAAVGDDDAAAATDDAAAVPTVVPTTSLAPTLAPSSSTDAPSDMPSSQPIVLLEPTVEPMDDMTMEPTVEPGTFAPVSFSSPTASQAAASVTSSKKMVLVATTIMGVLGVMVLV